MYYSVGQTGLLAFQGLALNSDHPFLCRMLHFLVMQGMLQNLLCTGFQQKIKVRSLLCLLAKTPSYFSDGFLLVKSPSTKLIVVLIKKDYLREHTHVCTLTSLSSEGHIPIVQHRYYLQRKQRRRRNQLASQCMYQGWPVFSHFTVVRFKKKRSYP